jgi:hypothetical protein
MAREGRAAGESLPDSALGRALAAGTEVDGILVTDEALAGDEAARSVVELIGRRLGVALASLANVFDPDVIVIGGGRLNMTPMADPVGCLVAQANPSNVMHVLVAGRFVKRDGELCGVDLGRALELAQAASERVLKRISDQGLELLPPAPDGLADTINKMATQNLARAWTLDIEASSP